MKKRAVLILVLIFVIGCAQETVQEQPKAVEEAVQEPITTEQEVMEPPQKADKFQTPSDFAGLEDNLNMLVETGNQIGPDHAEAFKKRIDDLEAQGQDVSILREKLAKLSAIKDEQGTPQEIPEGGKPPEGPPPTESYETRQENLKKMMKEIGTKCKEETPGYTVAASLVIDHEDTDNIYVAIRLKGVYKSTDGGKTWQAKNNGIFAYPDQEDMTKKCYDWAGFMEIDPTNPKRILLLPTDKNTGLIDDPYTEMSGIWETTDGGNSWRQMVHGDTNAGGHGGLAIDPNNPETIYFSSSNYAATYTEADPDDIFNTVGVLHKTTDNGKTWTELPTGWVPKQKTTATDTFYVTNLFVNPEDSNHLVGISQAHGHTEDDQEQEVDEQMGIIISKDAGKTWTSYSNLPEDYQTMSQGDVALQNFNNIFVNVHRFDYRLPPLTKHKSFYSTDGGKTFKQTTFYIHLAKYNPYDPTGKHMIGFAPWKGTEFFESKDAGKSWSTIAKPAAFDGYDMPAYDIVFDPKDQNIIYITGYSANVWKTTNGGSSWKKILDLEMIS